MATLLLKPICKDIGLSHLMTSYDLVFPQVLGSVIVFGGITTQTEKFEVT